MSNITLYLKVNMPQNLIQLVNNLFFYHSLSTAFSANKQRILLGWLKELGWQALFCVVLYTWSVSIIVEKGERTCPQVVTCTVRCCRAGLSPFLCNCWTLPFSLYVTAGWEEPTSLLRVDQVSHQSPTSAWRLFGPEEQRLSPDKTNWNCFFDPSGEGTTVKTRKYQNKIIKINTRSKWTGKTSI